MLQQPTTHPDLSIPEPEVIQARLAQIQSEADYLHSLLRLVLRMRGEDAEAERRTPPRRSRKAVADAR